MSRYAAGTDVTSDRSRAEIERTLTRYGAESFPAIEDAYATGTVRPMLAIEGGAS